jgi:hypothetical protein
MTSLRRLWRGHIELGRAFWEYAVVYGLILNLVATGAAMAVIVANGPMLLAAVLFLLPVPYNMVAAIGVWRSADRYGGPPARARLARCAVVVWAVALSVA